MEKLQGRIKYVAKTRGIILEDREGYLNPTARCKDFVKPDMTGSEVELDMKDDKTFDFIKVIRPVLKSVPKPGASTAKLSEEKPDWDAKEKRMIRMNVLNRAVDMFNAGHLKKEEIIDTAVKFESWIHGTTISEVIHHEKVGDTPEYVEEETIED